MSRWTHPMCEACWIDLRLVPVEGGFQISKPHRLTDPPLENCCRCGRPTIVGIYVREDPAAMANCGGHDDD